MDGRRLDVTQVRELVLDEWVLDDGETPSSPRALAAADAYVERSRSLPTIVDRWFAENTFHASEVRNVAKLLDLVASRPAVQRAYAAEGITAPIC